MRENIKKFFSLLFAFVVAIILFICAVFLLPFDYIKYKRSVYYRRTKEKYRLFAASGNKFELYNEIIENNLPIDFVANPGVKLIEYGWLVFEKTLIISDVFSFEFDSEKGEWVYSCEDEDENSIVMSFDEFIHIEIEEINLAAGRDICNEAIVLIDSDYIENEEKANFESRFLIYNNNRIEKLKEFCESRVSISPQITATDKVNSAHGSIQNPKDSED